MIRRRRFKQAKGKPHLVIVVAGESNNNFLCVFAFVIQTKARLGENVINCFSHISLAVLTKREVAGIIKIRSLSMNDHLISGFLVLVQSTSLGHKMAIIYSR